MENIIVGLAIAAAGIFAVYRLFFRPGCGCASGCACDKSGPGKTGHGTCCEGRDSASGSNCCCGK